MTQAVLSNGTVLNFPDGTDPEIIQQTVKKVMAAPPADVSAPIAGGGQPTAPVVDDRSLFKKGSDYLRGLENSVVGGMTGNFNDEIAAGGGAVGGAIGNLIKGNPADIGGEYNASLAEHRKFNKNFQEDHPVSAFTGEMGGAAVSPLTRALMGKGVPANASMTARVGSSALGGARTGAIYGAGGDEGDLVDRAGAAGKGALLGAALGGAAPAVVDATGNTARMVLDQTVGRLPFKQPDLAARKLAEALQRDGIDPNYYNAAEAKLNQIGPDAALMDVGPNSRGLARAAYTTPGEGKTQIGDFLTARQEGTRDAGNVLQGGQAGRVAGQIEALVPGNAQAAQNATIAARGRLGTNYEAAKASTTPVDTQPLIAGIDKQLENAKGGIQTGLAKARSYLLKADGTPDTSIAGLHEAKMAIDDLISGTGDSSIGRTAQSRLKAVQSDLVDAIEKAAPDYRTGRLGTAAEWQKSDALEAGGKLFSKSEFTNPDEMKSALAKMGREELDHFRIGAVQALKDKIGDMVTRADVTKKLMDVPALEAKVKLAFGDDALFKKYIDGLKGEKAMFESYSDITKGSRTTPLAAEMADAKVDPSRLVEGARQIFMPTHLLDPVRGAVNVLGGAKDRLMMPPGQSRELAKLLTGQNTDALNRQMQNVPVNQGRRAALARALTLTGGVGQGQ